MSIRTEPVVMIVGSTMAGLAVGAIVASVASSSRKYPILKGSLTGGAIYLAFSSLAAFALYEDPTRPNTLSGPPQPLRFRGFP